MASHDDKTTDHSRWEGGLLKKRKEEPAVLFLHIPKTGGTTLEKVLYAEFSKSPPASGDQLVEGWIAPGAYYFLGLMLLAENEMAGFFRAKQRNVRPEVLAAVRRPDVKLIMGHFSFGLHEYVERPSTYVTFLRDPIERVLSLYYHLLHFPPHPNMDWTLRDCGRLQRLIASKKFTLDRFISEAFCKEADNDQTRRISGVDADYGECSADMLKEAKANLRERFAVVGVTERFDESLLLLGRKFGWTELCYVPAVVNRGRPPRATLDSETIAMVARQNEFDVALYRYGCALLEQAIASQGESFEEDVRRFRARNEEYAR